MGSLLVWGQMVSPGMYATDGPSGRGAGRNAVRRAPYGVPVRYVAFLGGINVGGHRVAMDRLRQEFEALGHDDVRTFIASGNVIFTTGGRAPAIERTVEAHLTDRLGYGVPTFVRTAVAVRKVAACEPFGELAAGDSSYVGFLRTAPTAAAARATEALSNDQDRFEVHGKELHWLIHGGMSDTSVKPSVLGRALGVGCTTRNTMSLRKLADTL
jgi:uncharacterized protein (DUF1697 family)